MFQFGRSRRVSFQMSVAFPKDGYRVSYFNSDKRVFSMLCKTLTAYSIEHGEPVFDGFYGLPYVREKGAKITGFDSEVVICDAGSKVDTKNPALFLEFGRDLQSKLCDIPRDK